ncbi:unnamed protein product, partial [Durusdinium trenchii]
PCCRESQDSHPSEPSGAMDALLVAPATWRRPPLGGARAGGTSGAQGPPPVRRSKKSTGPRLLLLPFITGLSAAFCVNTHRVSRAPHTTPTRAVAEPVLVCLGGGLGAVCRFAASKFGALRGWSVPWPVSIETPSESQCVEYVTGELDGLRPSGPHHSVHQSQPSAKAVAGHWLLWRLHHFLHLRGRGCAAPAARDVSHCCALRLAEQPRRAGCGSSRPALALSAGRCGAAVAPPTAPSPHNRAQRGTVLDRRKGTRRFPGAGAARGARFRALPPAASARPRRPFRTLGYGNGKTESTTFKGWSNCYLGSNDPYGETLHSMLSLVRAKYLSVDRFVSVVGSFVALQFLLVLKPKSVHFFDMNPQQVMWAQMLCELILMSDTPEEYISRVFARPVRTFERRLGGGRGRGRLTHLNQHRFLQRPVALHWRHQTLSQLSAAAQETYRKVLVPLQEGDQPGWFTPELLPCEDRRRLRTLTRTGAVFFSTRCSVRGTK